MPNQGKGTKNVGRSWTHVTLRKAVQEMPASRMSAKVERVGERKAMPLGVLRKPRLRCIGHQGRNTVLNMSIKRPRRSDTLQFQLYFRDITKVFITSSS